MKIFQLFGLFLWPGGKASKGFSDCTKRVDVHFSKNARSEVLNLGDPVGLYEAKFGFHPFRDRTAALKQVILVNVKKVRQTLQ